ncbi:MAG: TlpA disulfide reductase family protein [Candidatus Limnocylindrales bacterium]
MGGKLAIATGLVTGVVAGAILVGAVVVLAPGPVVPTASPVPSDVVASASPTLAGSPSTPASPLVSPSPSPVASPSAAGQTGFGVGRAAPPLSVPQIGGGEITLSGLKGKPVWVNFMASWCPPCRDELPLMNGFAARYQDQGLVILAIDVREDQTIVDAFAKEMGIVFPVGLDADGTAQSDWGAYALPVHFWIDEQGIVRDGALGGIGPDLMAKGLQTILPGVTVTP